MDTLSIVLIVTNVLSLAGLVLALRNQGRTVDWRSIDTKIDGLDPNFATQLVRNYTNNHLPIINQGMTNNNPTFTGDSRAVWFPIDVLKQFINEIEGNTYEKCDIAKLQAGAIKLGIRIYFGEYPANNSANQWFWSQCPATINAAQYENKHTLLMVPTYNDGTNTANTDFDPWHFNIPSNNSNVTPDRIGDVLNFLSQGAKANLLTGTTATTETKVLMLNHGGIIPPPYPPNDLNNAGAYLMTTIDA